MKHSDLVKKICIEGCKFPGIVLWNNPVGLGYNGRIVDEYTRNGKKYILIENPRYVKYGLCPGSSDIIGFRVRDGIPVFSGIEVKIGVDKTAHKQSRFIDMISNNGGYSGVARCADDLESILKL